MILDTDIGLDVDDVWALAFLLRCPELDLKLIVTATGDTNYSARLVAKLLQIAGREDIPIGIGIPLDTAPHTHSEWLGDYSLSDFHGDIFQDGVSAICRTVMNSPEPLTIVSIGPLPNIAAALAQSPPLTGNSRFIGMHGSLRRGYQGALSPMKEYNVKKHTASCQRVFETPWDISVTPLDTCGTVILKDDNFEKLKASNDPLTQAVIQNHFEWFKVVKEWPGLAGMDSQIQSSVLYDMVAVYMAFSESLLEMETLPIRVMDDGRTIIDDSGQKMRCATEWKDKRQFERLLSDRLA